MPSAPSVISSLSLHDALPISRLRLPLGGHGRRLARPRRDALPLLRLGLCDRSEEHTSELQSPCNLVCRLLLEKKKLIYLNYFLFFNACCTASTILNRYVISST